MPSYNLETIQATILRVLGKDVTLAKLQNELEKGFWVPELDRMIAVSQVEGDIATSQIYGFFEGMTRSNEYKISIGRFKFARLLTAEELAKCY